MKLRNSLKDVADPIDEKMRESCLRWFGYVQSRVTNATVRKIRSGKKDIPIKEITKNMILDRKEW